MPHDYIPRPDGGFDAWVANFWPAVQAFYNDHGLDVGDLDALEDALATWQQNYGLHIAAQAAARAARTEKDQARLALDAAIRPIVRFVQAFPETTDADRASIGITVRPPATSKTPTPIPTTRPLVSVDIPARLTHTLRLVDSGDAGGSGGRRGGKPEGVAGAEVWVKLIDAPHTGQPAGSPSGASQADPIGDPKTFSFLTMTTRPTLRTDFPTAAGGKTAVYMLRWVNTRGEKGPWSEVTTATVAA